MGLGVLLLVDLAWRATDLEAMYGDGGMFPRGKICFHYLTVWNWSFHFASGSWGYQAMLFVLAGLLAGALMAGFQTRLATVGSWVMLVSLHHRVPPILSGADILLRMLLFWGMFLPLEAAWSVDGWRSARGGNGVVKQPRQVLSVASAAILLQMGLMYLFSAIYKTNSAWLHGEAVRGILANNFYASALGSRLLHWPRLTAGMTWGTLALEWAAPFLLFCPMRTAKVRLWVVAALAAMHLCIAAFMEVDLFTPVALTGLALFLPAEFWDSRLFSRRAGPSPAAPTPAAEERRGQRQPVGAGVLVSQGVCLLAGLYVLAVNVNGLPSHPLGQLARDENTFLRTGCGLGQSWGMFDQVPAKNGWYVAAGKLKDGSQVDLLRHGAKLSWAKPAFPAAVYPNYRWRKCFREMSYEDEWGFQVFRQTVAEYLCRDWNARHSPARQLAEFELIYCNESGGRPDGSGPVPLAMRERFVHLDFMGPDGEQAMASGL